jgi:DNA-binding beta-propeller fold protein YncE
VKKIPDIIMTALVATASLATVLLTPVVSAAADRAADGKVYVPMGSSGYVLIVDATHDLVVGKIPNVPDAHGLAGAPGSPYLVAASIVEVDTAAKTIPAKPAGMSLDEHEAHHKKPDAHGTSESGAVSFLSILRIDGGTVVRRVEVPGAVHHTALTPDGRHALSTHLNGGKISVVDLQTYELVATIATGPQPNYIAVTSDGTKAYVSNAGNDTISEIDTGRWLLRRNFDAGATPEHLVISPDDRFLYVNNVGDGTVSEIALDSGKTVKTHAIGGALHGIDTADDGKTLFVSAKQRGKLAAIDLASGDIRTISLAPAPYHLTAVRGTGKIYVSSAKSPKMWVVDQKTLDVKGEIPVGGKAHQMVVVQR